MASSASTMREPRTSVVAWACEARRLPTAAIQAATANCSVEIASDNFSFARDFPARSMRTEFKFSILGNEVTGSGERIKNTKEYEEHEEHEEHETSSGELGYF